MVWLSMRDGFNIFIDSKNGQQKDLFFSHHAWSASLQCSVFTIFDNLLNDSNVVQY